MTENRRRIAVVTGTRAEYGLLKSSMESIRDRDDLKLQIIATGMHLSATYGETIKEIRDDGFDIAATPQMLIEGDSGAAMAKSLGLGVLGFVDTFQSLNPDIVLILGDRDEPLAAGLAAAHMNIPVAHIHGGDAAKGATIDESIRHALTKFAHLHFPVTEKSAERIQNLGEEPWRIEVVGAPGLDDVLARNYANLTELQHECAIDLERTTIVVLQHPLTKAPELAGEQMAETLDAIRRFDAQVVCIYPNSDAGSKSMIEQIMANSDEIKMRVFKSLPRRHYLALLDTADVLVGNSSSGLIEAPSMNLPVVDVGPRQAGRQRADNTVSVDHDAEEIAAAIQTALGDEASERAHACENPYARGGAGERIADRLSTVQLGTHLLSKKITY